jgi:hypothetical protein
MRRLEFAAISVKKIFRHDDLQTAASNWSCVGAALSGSWTLAI